MNDDREEMIRSLFPLVRRIARRVAKVLSVAELDDLVGDGAVGLIRAVDSFDPQRGVSLERYAGRVIVGAMLNGVRRLDPVSERVRRSIRNAERMRYAMASDGGELPSMSEMERRIPGLANARVKAHRGAALSLDAPLAESEAAAIDTTLDPQHVYADASQTRAVINAVSTLPPRERRVIALHYWRERSLRTLGSEMAISPQRVSQIHLVALERLRGELSAIA